MKRQIRQFLKRSIKRKETDSMKKLIVYFAIAASCVAIGSVRDCEQGRCATMCGKATGTVGARVAAGEPKISVFASFIRRIAKQRGISKSAAADLLYGMGVRGFDVGPAEPDLDELSATRLKPINFYYFPNWFGRKDDSKSVSPDACLARAAELGVPRIMVVPPNFSDGQDNPDEFERILAHMKDFVARAKERSITVTVEDFGGTRNCCSYMKYLKRFLDEIPDLRFALDTGNLYFAGRGEDILEMMAYAKGRVGHIHLKDQTAEDNRKYVTLGLGAVPNEEIVKAIACTDYDGWYTLENPVGDVLNDSVRQVALLKSWLAAGCTGGACDGVKH